MPSSAPLSSRRYVIRAEIGKGGMGVVYRAYDNETRREVTIKTLLDLSSPAMLDLFRKECEVLSRLNHPNIVDIYDIGEFVDDQGKRQPYFVMPLLPGVTLDRLIAGESQRLTVDRAVDIIAQACRGLHAAHERGLVHRDIKPSNIFVLEDDAVKLIDFGVAHLATAVTQTTIKGTLHYMAPEQVQAKKPTPLSDLYSLGVVCFEALTRRLPFEGGDSSEVVEAILHRTPPFISDLNPAVSRAVSQVVQKALAKHPVHRFPSIRDFGETLQKAARGEAIELFDETRMLTRLERARNALLGRELDLADEFLGGIESEGYGHPEVTSLRREIDRALRDKNIGQLLERARRCFAEDETQLALQKIQEIFEIEPRQPDALALQGEIENKRSGEQIGKWMMLAGQHLNNQAYGHARQALEDVLRLKPGHTDARKMLSIVEFRESEHERIRREKESRYQAAMEEWRRGDVSAALGDLERVMALIDQAPDKSDPTRADRYQNFYNQVRSEHDALRDTYTEARKLLADREFDKALAICEETLAKHPGHALFQSLKVDVEEAQRQGLSAFIAQVDRAVEAEPDLDRRVNLLREALESRPGEAHFEHALQLTTSKRDLVNGIVLKARRYEESRQFSDALNQWGMLRTIYSGYPGLNLEIERLVKRRDHQARLDAKARCVQQIDQSLGLLDWDRALDQVRSALGEFPDDGELKSLEQLASQGQAQSARSAGHMDRARALQAEGNLDGVVAELEQGRAADPRNASVRAALVDAILAKARAVLEEDPESTARLIAQALEIDPRSTSAKTLGALLDDRKRERFVDEQLSQARNLQASGDLEQAIAVLDRALESYPRENRLAQLRGALERARSQQQRAAVRLRDLEEARRLEARADEDPESGELDAAFARAAELAAQYRGDNDFESIVDFLRERLTVARAAAQSQARPLEIEPAAPASVVTAVTPAAPPAQPAPADTATRPIRRPRAPLPWRWIAVVAACACAIAVLLVVAIHKRQPSGVPVSFSVEPAGAKVIVDGKPEGSAPVHLSLLPGPHRVEASAPGYQPFTGSWDVRPGFSPALVQLTPLLARLEVSSDLSDVRALLDGEPRDPIGPGSPLDVSNVPVNAQHSLQLTVERHQLEISFQTAAARAPEVRLSGDAAAPVAALSVFGSSGRFYSSGPLKVSVDGGTSYRDAGPEGLDLPQLPPDGILTVQVEGNARKLPALSQHAAPAVSVFLLASTPVAAFGAISIDAPEAGFDVLIGGKPFRYSSKNGPPFMIYNVPEGSHSVAIQKPGYRVEPESQTAVVTPNGRARVKFNLTPVKPTIALHGGIPGTRVAIGQQILSVDTAGELAAVAVEPGTYNVVLSKKGYRDATSRYTLSLGKSVVIEPPVSRLKPISGTIRFTNPLGLQGVRIRIRQQSGVPMEGPENYDVVPSGPIELPVGSYEITFSAPGFKPNPSNVSLPEYPLYEVSVPRLERP
jgi:eukaryotic-like serine/threonine-protein kinase